MKDIATKTTIFPGKFANNNLEIAKYLQIFGKITKKFFECKVFN